MSTGAAAAMMENTGESVPVVVRTGKRNRAVTPPKRARAAGLGFSHAASQAENVSAEPIASKKMRHALNGMRGRIKN